MLEKNHRPEIKNLHILRSTATVFLENREFSIGEIPSQARANRRGLAYLSPRRFAVPPRGVRQVRALLFSVVLCWCN